MPHNHRLEADLGDAACPLRLTRNIRRPQTENQRSSAQDTTRSQRTETKMTTRHLLLALAVLLPWQRFAVARPDYTELAMPENRPPWCEVNVPIPRPPGTACTPGSAEACTASLGDDQGETPVFSLALSGGGYRAMLFHVGALRRLNDAGMLPRLTVISSTSGGSIVAGYLAYKWPRLIFERNIATNFEAEIESELRLLAEKTMDIPSVITGFLPFISAGDQIVRVLDAQLFRDALLSTLSASPPALLDTAQRARPRPTFIINATNLQTSELWQFRANVMGGPVTGWTFTGNTKISQAVAASAAYPPVLSPISVTVSPPDSSVALTGRLPDCRHPRDTPHGVNHDHEPARYLETHDLSLYANALLIDGGVKDNLGIGAIQEINRLRRHYGFSGTTVTFISDGGLATKPDPNPYTNWFGQSLRVIDLLLDQPDEVRVSQIIGEANLRRSREEHETAGINAACLQEPPSGEPLREKSNPTSVSMDQDIYAYWSIRRLPKLHRGFDCPAKPKEWLESIAPEIKDLSTIKTRLASLSKGEQMRLINWGYLAAHHGIPYARGYWSRSAVWQDWPAGCEALPFAPTAIPDLSEISAARNLQCLMRKMD